MTTRTYPHDHPFSPHYEGRVAKEFCAPRYPNRVQPPKPEVKRRLTPGEAPAPALIDRGRAKNTV